jgi:hypothetical protein
MTVLSILLGAALCAMPIAVFYDIHKSLEDE